MPCRLPCKADCTARCATPGINPRSRHSEARRNWGIIMYPPASKEERWAVRAVTKVLVRERKLAPKNLIKEASVKALVAMAIKAQTGRHLASEPPWMVA